MVVQSRRETAILGVRQSLTALATLTRIREGLVEQPTLRKFDDLRVRMLRENEELLSVIRKILSRNKDDFLAELELQPDLDRSQSGQFRTGAQRSARL